MKKVQELLKTGDGIEGQLLIPRTIHAQLIEEAEKKRIGRSAAAIVVGPNGIKGASYDVDLMTPNSMDVYQIAEGSKITLDEESYETFNMKPTKYGVSLKITNEMQEDGKFDLLPRNVRTAAKRLAENEDSLIISDAWDNAGNTVTGGAAILIANITRGIQYLEDNDYEATDMYIGPEVANDLRNIDTFVEADKAGISDPSKSLIGRIFNMDVHVVSANIMNTKYAYIIDRNHSFMIVEKRPLTVSNFDDTTGDMTGSTATQRIKVRQLRANATCKITTT